MNEEITRIAQRAAKKILGPTYDSPKLGLVKSIEVVQRAIEEALLNLLKDPSKLRINILRNGPDGYDLYHDDQINAMIEEAKMLAEVARTK